MFLLEEVYDDISGIEEKWPNRSKFHAVEV